LVAPTAARVPLKLPSGVRTALTITAFRMSLSFLSWAEV
jgi:hypothetical protein